jgi:hypothetical protein
MRQVKPVFRTIPIWRQSPMEDEETGETYLSRWYLNRYKAIPVDQEPPEAPPAASPSILWT